MAVFGSKQFNTRELNSAKIIDYTDKSIEYAELYMITITKLNDLEITLTSYDQDIEYGGYTWTAIPLERRAIKYHTSLQVDELEVTAGVYGVTFGSHNYSMVELIQYGFLDNAKVDVYRIIPTKPELGHVLLYPGHIRKKVGFKDGTFTFSITHVLDDLQRRFPTKYYQEQCNHSLFSSYCGLDRNTYVSSGIVEGGSTRTMLISSTFLSQGEGYFEHGKVEFTSGDDQYITVSIERCTSNHVYLYTELPHIPSNGDNFLVYPGCDKTGTMCHSKFNNYTNFLGFEHIPKPEVMHGL